MKAFLFPGQGSQYKGMGEDLLGDFKTLVGVADEVVGYSIKELCLEDPSGRLAQTRYTQPALFVVSALTHLKHFEESAEHRKLTAEIIAYWMGMGMLGVYRVIDPDWEE